MADEPKKPPKDLTGIMEYSRDLERQGKGMPIPQGAVMDEIKIDKIDDFESLDAYSKTHPAAEPPPEEVFSEEPAAPPAEAPPPEPEPEPAPAAEAAPAVDNAFAVSEPNAAAGAQADNPLAMDGLADALPGGAPPPPDSLGGITDAGGQPAQGGDAFSGHTSDGVAPEFKPEALTDAMNSPGAADSAPAEP